MANPASPISWLKNFSYAGLGAPALLLAIIGMMAVPLAPAVLDALFTFNIALSLVVLLAVINVMRPLDFSAFPSVLLVATLLRLALNVASTRVVLLHGHEGTHAAGRVIQSFGEFVIGGSYAVGLVVFAILTIINFVVVTKGAGRISEVSARFVLDALPGKQMAIDADLNAGLISREEAKTRREEVREEMDFYGSMDGASKFVRGDAVAGILILFINLLGGLAIGILQHDLSAGDAAKTYILLAIGDGLVAQIPALLTSVAVAVLVTRVSRAQDMGRQVVGQIFAEPRTLGMTAAVVAILGMVPGMPSLVFFSLAGALAWGARRIVTRRAQAKVAATAAPAAPTEAAEVGWDDVQLADALGLEVGYRVIPLVDRNQGGPLMARIKALRKKLSSELGFLVPAVHIRDNLELKPGGYRILLHGVPVAAAEIYPDREMALNPGRVFARVDGIPGKDPAFGLEAVWIEPSRRLEAQSAGYTVVDASTVIATHLSHLIRAHAHELLGHDEAQQLLQGLAKSAPKLVEDLTPKLLPLSTIVRVLQALLFEHVPIRQLRLIAEALVANAPTSQDVQHLTAAVRTSLSRLIVQEINGMEPELPVYTLASGLERLLQDSVGGGGTALEPTLAERLHHSVAECVQRQEAAGEPAVLLVPGSLRPMLAKFMRNVVPGLHVLAYHEVPEAKRLRLVGAIG